MVQTSVLEQREPLEALRLQLQRSIRGVLTGGRPPVRHEAVPDEAGRSPDPGWFGPESVTWRIHADAAMLVGGIRALILQTMHPLAMAGVAQHSRYREDPAGRLWRTASYVGMTSFGSSEQAQAAVRAMRSAHRSVHGVAPDGRPYRASDPHLMAWVQFSLVDSFLAAYRRYGGTPLTAEDADRYVAEQAALAARIGALDPVAPQQVEELNGELARFRPELRADATARDAVRFLLFPPLPLAHRPAYAVLASSAVGLLPGFVRRQLWLPRLPVTEALAVRPAARRLVRVLDWALRP